MTARIARGNVCLGGFWQRREAFLFENRFYFFTLHGTSLREERRLGYSSHETLY